MDYNRQIARTLGTIGAYQTLVENFPMSMFQGKHYTSVIEFLIDILNIAGASVDELINRLIQKLDSRDNGDRVAKLKAFKNKVQYVTDEETFYEALEDLDIDFTTNPKWKQIEEWTKRILGNALAGLLSCNCIPIIQDDVMDEYPNKSKCGFMSIPLHNIDIYNKLSIDPTSTVGACVYQMEGVLSWREIPSYAVPKNAEIINETELPDPTQYKNDGKTKSYVLVDDKYYKLGQTTFYGPNSLYMSDDLDAFLWYCINRGLNNPQQERNKTVWDTRLQAKKLATDEKPYLRDTAEGWSTWLNSKKGSEDSFTGEDENLVPLMQIYCDNNEAFGNTINVAISSQEFYRSGKKRFLDTMTPNKTMYEFNTMYLDNVQLFTPKQVLACLIKTLFGGTLNGGFSFGMTLQQKQIIAKLKAAVANIIQNDDMSIEDCYYTFSNAQYDEMLNQTELEKYNAVATGDGTAYVRNVTTEELFEELNTSEATKAGYTTTVKKALQTIDNRGGVETQNGVETAVAFSLNNSDLLSTLIAALIEPILEALLSPKIMLLFMINLQSAGIINLHDLQDEDSLMEFCMKKLLALIVPIIKMVKDYIIDWLFEMIKEFLVPLLELAFIVLLNERVMLWIDYLYDVLTCLPTFDIQMAQLNASISDVRYADIEENEQSTPSNDKTNC